MVGADERATTCRLELFLERLAKRLTAVRVATTSFVPRLTDISANKDMMAKRWHRLLQIESEQIESKQLSQPLS